MNNITEQERQAIEAAAKKYARKIWDNGRKFGSVKQYSEQDYLAGIEFALSELRKPDEDLVKQILVIMDDESKSDQSDSEYLLGGQFAKVASEIAKLAPFRDANAELLEAQDLEYRANRFIQTLLDNGILLNSEMQKRISNIYINTK